MSAERRWKRYQYVLLFVLAFIPQIYKLSMPFYEMFSGFVSDDAFYYYKTALNIRNGLGSSFDTYNITNGYHPLWMVVCVAIAFFTTDLTLYLYLVLGANLIVVLLLSIVVFRMFRQTLGDLYSAALVCSLNWNYTASTALFSGMETPLYVLLLLVTVAFMNAFCLRKRYSWMVLGVLLGLTFLARTDFVLVLPVAAGFVVYRLRKNGLLHLVFSHGLLCLLSFAILVAPYLYWNYSVTGHFQQISGLIRHMEAGSSALLLSHAAKFVASVVSCLFIRTRFIPLHVFIPCAVVMMAMVFALSPRAIMRNLRTAFSDRRLLLLAAYSVVFICYYIYMVRGHPLQPWHLAFVYVASNILLMHIVQALVEAQGKTLVVYVLRAAVLILVLNNFLEVFYMRSVFSRRNYHFVAPVFYGHEAAVWMRENLPADAKVGVWDAGYVGYFSERNVVNLDGLINGRKLYEYLQRENGIWEYVMDEKLDYISNYFFGEPLPVRAPIAPHLELVHHVGGSDVTIRGRPTYVDWYVWKVVMQEEGAPP
ncbi:MAG: hypothetical protein JXB04_03610 [Kiritimatiellae bacterium]|nr:hypothetical protein [Kiritimatiellia bacterium]